MTVKISAYMRNVVLDNEISGLLYGTLKLYTGTQPATGGGTHSDTLLATINLSGNTGAASGGVLGVTIVTGTTVAANGDVGWGRLNSGSTTLDLNITATGGGGDLEMDNIAVTTSDTVDTGTIDIEIKES